jgi:hypothetical protein
VPRDGALVLSDLPARGLDRLRVLCGTCGRAGLYRLETALQRWGEDQKLTDLLTDLTADCPRGKRVAIMDQCGARYLDL